MAQYQHLYLHLSENMNSPPNDGFRFWNIFILRNFACNSSLKFCHIIEIKTMAFLCRYKISVKRFVVRDNNCNCSKDCHLEAGCPWSLQKCNFLNMMHAWQQLFSGFYFNRKCLKSRKLINIHRQTVLTQKNPQELLCAVQEEQDRILLWEITSLNLEAQFLWL